MKCAELQSDLSLFADGFLAESDLLHVKGHLETCPLCRQKYSEIREIKTTLRRMTRPEMSLAVRDQLKRSINTEIRSSKRRWFPISSEVRSWLQMQVMPYSVGVMTSLTVGFAFLTMMYSGLLAPRQPKNPFPSENIMLASNSDPFKSRYSDTLSASDYAQSRLEISSESPSVNPQGALIALTKSLVRGGMKDDEVTVVADVFGNGLAQIAEVVEPSRDRQAVSELQKALDSDPAYAAFVPATLDKRSDSVRVVLKFQSVSVSTGLSRHRR